MELKCFTMNTEHVSAKIYFLIESFATDSAHERPLLSVNKVMSLQVCMTVGFVLAHIAREFVVFLGMNLKMLLKITGTVTFIVTKRTLKMKHKFFSVHFQMTYVFSFLKKG